MIAHLALLFLTTPMGFATSDTASSVKVFRGIPYAKPPVGDLRFAPPVPAGPWDGTLDAKSFGPQCMQLPLFGDMNFRANGMSEDCLHLNIWTPMKKVNDRLPVLVYFFGGKYFVRGLTQGAIK